MNRLYTTLNTTVLAPIPSAKHAIAASAKPGLFRKTRKANLTSSHTDFINLNPSLGDQSVFEHDWFESWFGGNIDGSRRNTISLDIEERYGSPLKLLHLGLNLSLVPDHNPNQLVGPKDGFCS